MEGLESPQFHEYFKAEDYYESRSISKGRKTKTCEHCGGAIPIGQPHTMHHFYPEFEAVATHNHCIDAFKASLIPSEPVNLRHEGVTDFEKVKIGELLENDELCNQMLNFIRSTGAIKSSVDHLTRVHGVRPIVATDYLYSLCKLHDISLFKLP